MNQRERFNRVMHFQPVDRVLEQKECTGGAPATAHTGTYGRSDHAGPGGDGMEIEVNGKQQ